MKKLKKSFKQDPRIAISKHIAWVRPCAMETEYCLPEPDDYNYGVLGKEIVECKFIEDNVFYKDLNTDMWWSIYYVPKDKVEKFLTWLEQQTFELYWNSQRSGTLRNKRPLLYVRKNQPELTTEERLYSMGYYANLHSKYFSDNDTILLERLGPARAEIWTIGTE